MPHREEIGSKDSTVCEVCGAAGRILYAGLEDVLYGVPGKWNIRQCTNQGCGMLWLDPMPLMDELHKAYRSYSTHQDLARKESLLARLTRRAYAGYRAHRYGFKASSTSGSDRLLGIAAALLAPVRQQMAFPFAYFAGIAKARMLEIGCGGGESLKQFADWGWQTEGLDFDQAAVANARAKGLTVHQGDVFSCRYEADSFEAIYSSHVLEHVPAPGELLEECFRILKPGGRCVMLTPNAASIGHRWYKSAWRGLEPPRHLHIFTPDALAKLARSAGFTDFRIDTSSRLAASMYIPSAMVRKDGKTATRAPLKLKVGAMLVHYAAYVFRILSRNSGEELVIVGYKPK